LRYDREEKARLCAASAVPEYRIVNLVDHVVEVYRQPSAGCYREVTTARKARACACSRFQTPSSRSMISSADG
jgi:hypothetical protein